MEEEDAGTMSLYTPEAVLALVAAVSPVARKVWSISPAIE
jgi:hypothetical protein